MTSRNYLYSQLIHKHINWERIEDRLERYPGVNSCFPVEFLHRFDHDPPYYCHFMAWRLGVWDSEQAFQMLEQLLQGSASLIGWTAEKCRNNSPEYDQFFSLIWELQVANALALQSNSQVQWLPKGPDLLVEYGSEKLYVECYSYRKSFGIEAFLEDILVRVHERIKVQHGPAMVFSLPHNKLELAGFFEELFEPFLDSKSVDPYLEESLHHYPVLLPIPSTATNLCIYVDGTDRSYYDPLVPIPRGVGDTDKYLETAIDEIIRNKQDSNNLKSHHPNLLAASVLLGRDFQMVVSSSQTSNTPLPIPNLSGAIDGLWLNSVSIDEVPKLHKGWGFTNDPVVARLWPGFKVDSGQ